MNLPSLFILIIVLVLIVVSIFGLQIMMMTHDQGSISSCPFMNGASICRMSPIEHVSKWQSLFNATLSSILLSAILGFVFLSFTVLSNINILKSEIVGIVRKTDFRLLDHLHIAFSKGILHSKIYNIS